MISINKLSYYLGDRALYDEASLFITPKDKIGLIGLNGTGKSTLLKMISGETEASGGDISMSKGTSIGFLNQDLLSYQSDEPILEVAMLAFQEAHDLQHQIDQVLHQMETDYHDDLVNKLAKLQERFEAVEGYTIQSRAEEILEGIGFKTQDLQRPLKEFSGGWRMRVMLAKLLLEQPSLLMLDEPTNHLDLPSIKWLETYLQSYEGAVIIVSHDRRFQVIGTVGGVYEMIYLFMKFLVPLVTTRIFEHSLVSRLNQISTRVRVFKPKKVNRVHNYAVENKTQAESEDVRIKMLKVQNKSSSNNHDFK